MNHEELFGESNVERAMAGEGKLTPLLYHIDVCTLSAPARQWEMFI